MKGILILILSTLSHILISADAVEIVMLPQINTTSRHHPYIDTTADRQYIDTTFSYCHILILPAYIDNILILPADTAHILIPSADRANILILTADTAYILIPPSDIATILILTADSCHILVLTADIGHILILSADITHIVIFIMHKVKNEILLHYQEKKQTFGMMVNWIIQ